MERLHLFGRGWIEVPSNVSEGTSIDSVVKEHPGIDDDSKEFYLAGLREIRRRVRERLNESHARFFIRTL